MKLKDKIPSIYHPMISEVLNIESPDETIATCDTCTACRSSQSPQINTKCCFFHPHLPNFIIGYILTDEDEAYELGRQRLQDQIKAKAGITPYGTLPPTPYFNLRIKEQYQNLSSETRKLMETLLCPYYDNGRCSVYKYRNSTCTTYYCSSIGGVAGQTFWNNMKTYLKLAETTLSQFAMQQLGWPSAKINTKAVTTSDFDIEDEQGNINIENYRTLWAEWDGREEEFFIKCYEIVRKVDTNKFKQITGLKAEILEATIQDNHKNFLKNILPEKLILNTKADFETAKDGITRIALGKVSAKIPSLIVPLIRGFNGKRTTLEVFQLGFDVLYNIEGEVDELREKGILIKV